MRPISNNAQFSINKEAENFRSIIEEFKEIMDMIGNFKEMMDNLAKSPLPAESRSFNPTGDSFSSTDGEFSKLFADIFKNPGDLGSDAASQTGAGPQGSDCPYGGGKHKTQSFIEDETTGPRQFTPPYSESEAQKSRPMDTMAIADGDASTPDSGPASIEKDNTTTTAVPQSPTGQGDMTDFNKYMEIEGGMKIDGSTATVDITGDDTMVTENGAGGRQEAKVSEAYRQSIKETDESFSADYKLEMDPGYKFIIAQEHAGGLGAFAKLYVSDLDKNAAVGKDGAFETADGVTPNLKAGDGVYDVYARIQDESGKEQTKFLATVESGDSLHVEMANHYGKVSFGVNGNTFSQTPQDDDETYSKFGLYGQNQHVDGDEVVKAAPDNLAEHQQFLESQGIQTVNAVISNINYQRNA